MTEQIEDTRETRDNNPFGVTGSNTDSYPGIVDTDPPLFVFDTLQSGVNAGFELMRKNYFDKGYNTPQAIGDRWSGDKTGGYGKSLASIMGRGPSDILSYWTDGIGLMNGISKMENGPGMQLAYTSLALGLLHGGTA